MILRRLVRPLLAATLACALSACAHAPGQKGQTGRAASIPEEADYPEDYREPKIQAEYRKLSGQAQRAYRNEVIDARRRVLDRQHERFTDMLDEGRRNDQFGFDLIHIILDAVAVLSPGSAADTAVLSSGLLAGERSAEKNLYFDKTSDALIAAMDAKRTRVLTRIELNKAKDTVEYPLETALGELDDYRRAGKLREGLSALTDAAVSARIEADAIRDTRIVLKCETDESLNAKTQPIQAFKTRLYIAVDNEKGSGRVTEANRLTVVAQAFGVDVVGKTSAQLELAIDNAFGGGFCTAAEVDQLATRLRQANVGFN